MYDKERFPCTDEMPEETPQPETDNLTDNISF